MRILFVSGTSVGGAARSTHELASALTSRGHEVAVLSAIDEADGTGRIHEQFLDAGVKLPFPASSVTERTRRRIGARLVAEPGREYPSWRAAVPENALGAAIERTRPDVVVVSSVRRPAWRQIHAELTVHGLPRVLYMRERPAVLHFEAPFREPDLVLSNSQGHADAAAVFGVDATVIPSLVDTAHCLVESTRQRVVFINPVELFGVDVALALAGARPDIPFTFVRNWPMTSDELSSLQQAVDALPNVELVDSRRDPRDVYRDARIVLVPYRHPGRPRVVAEAHANGIPVLGSTEDGVAEAIRPLGAAAGLVVNADGPVQAWVDARSALWDDDEFYAEQVSRTQEFAARPEVQPDAIVERFERSVAAVVRPREVRDMPPAKAGIDISVVVPAHNAVSTLGAQLDALIAQTTDLSFEVLVVDNQSSDTTTAVALAYARRDPRIRRVVANGGSGPSYARNAGARAARGPVLACCDADDVVAGDWVDAMHAAVKAHRFVAGALDVEALNPTWVVDGRGRAIAQRPMEYGAVVFPHGCNTGIERDLLLAHPFDESVRAGEEIDLAVRLLRFGVPCTPAPDALVYYRYRDSARDTYRQAFIVGRAQRALRARIGDGAPPVRVLRRLAWLAWNVPRLTQRSGRLRWAWLAGDMAGRVAAYTSRSTA